MYILIKLRPLEVGFKSINRLKCDVSRAKEEHVINITQCMVISFIILRYQVLVLHN